MKLGIFVNDLSSQALTGTMTIALTLSMSFTERVASSLAISVIVFLHG